MVVSLLERKNKSQKGIETTYTPRKALVLKRSGLKERINPRRELKLNNLVKSVEKALRIKFRKERINPRRELKPECFNDSLYFL